MNLSQYQASIKGCQRKRLLPALVLLTVLCLMLANNNALAADAANRQQAIDLALQQNGGAGKVLGVREITDQNGLVIYAVKVLIDGRIRVIQIKQSR